MRTSSISYSIVLIFSIVLLVGCSLFSKEDEGKYVARVNDHYLTQDDMDAAMRETVVADTAAFKQNYINIWATNQLLLDGAMRNVAKIKRDRFNQLVESYKRDLYTKFYSDVLINKQLDSVVSTEEAAKFYEANKDNFKLNESLVQFKFIQVEEDYNIKNVKKHFISGEEEDVKALDSLKFQYKNYFLNDSSWVKQSAVMRQINAINKENVDRVLKKTNFIQLRDSLGLYLIAVKNTLDRNDMAPLQYVRPTINQIIINKRKLALIKKLEKEIKDDAIKNKQFEVYN